MGENLVGLFIISKKFPPRNLSSIPGIPIWKFNAVGLFKRFYNFLSRYTRALANIIRNNWNIDVCCHHFIAFSLQPPYAGAFIVQFLNSETAIVSALYNMDIPITFLIFFLSTNCSNETALIFLELCIKTDFSCILFNFPTKIFCTTRE